MPIPEIVREKIEYVASYVCGSIKDWYLIKNEIIHQLPGQIRGSVGFTKRHRSTKKMTVNDTERELMELWELLTGIRPVIDPKRTHDPNWVSRPKGWALNGGKERALQEEAARNANQNSQGDDR